MNKIYRNFSIILLVTLTACSILNSPRGPNEFAVMKSHTLVIPGDFELVEPKEDIDETAQMKNIDAKDILYSKKSVGASHSTLSSGENLLLEKFATDKKDSKVKDLLRKEEQHKTQEQQGKSWFWSKIWRSKTTLSKDSTTSGENSSSSIKNSKSLDELMKTDSKSKRICNVENGSIQYCDDKKIMKTISIDAGSSNK